MVNLSLKQRIENTRDAIESTMKNIYPKNEIKNITYATGTIIHSITQNPEEAHVGGFEIHGPSGHWANIIVHKRKKPEIHLTITHPEEPSSPYNGFEEFLRIMIKAKGKYHFQPKTKFHQKLEPLAALFQRKTRK